MTSQKLYTRPSDSSLRSGCLFFCSVFAASMMLCSGLVGLGHLAAHPVAYSVALFMASLTVVPYLWLLRWIDRNEPEPWALVCLSFLWGAFVATGFAMIINDGASFLVVKLGGSVAQAEFVKMSITAPIGEEFAKGLALLAIFVLFRREFDNLIDGIFYGAIIGLGFAWFENIIYYMRPFLDQDTGTSWGDMFALVYARGLVSASGGTHAAYTALTGAALGFFRERRSGSLRWMVPFFGLGLAIFAHFVWNTYYPTIALWVAGPNNEQVAFWLGIPVSVLLLQVPFAGLLVLLVWGSWSAEIKIIWQYLRTENPEIITRTELERLLKRRTRKWDSLANLWQGMFFWWERHSLTQLQVKLAFTKWHHQHDEGITWSVDEDQEVHTLREKIKKLRQRIREKNTKSKPRT